MRLCPECGNPPQYHSFCTRCCRLFLRSAGRARYQVQLEAQREARRRKREPILAALRTLRERGVSADQVEAALGLTPVWLCRYCKLAALPPFRRPRRPPPAAPSVWTPDRLAVLRQLLVVERLSYSVAAARLKMSRGAVSGAAFVYHDVLFGPADAAGAG